ncbi:hypothetical protein RvY_05822 [Ramazzottius varieornatus]|uniref:Uncharacterized protein n=1 Tax=Ramazzottius varieornatus TaxID=947166 RepID=A0A1D1V1Z4_RAMVA|nr:hypothetical protein RvY_05822 [Ramazzottius varieornatus]
MEAQKTLRRTTTRKLMGGLIPAKAIQVQMPLLLQFLLLTFLTGCAASPASWSERHGQFRRRNRGTAGDSNAPCRLPTAWDGQWFQSGIPGVISINETSMTSKGDCLQHKAEKYSDKYLFLDRKENCYTCVAASLPHPNVLQYKESLCMPMDEVPAEGLSIDGLCNDIRGDAPLYSMFRLNTSPETCPFRGRFSFTYALGPQGYRTCQYPRSEAQSCVKESEIMLHYKSCPDLTEERKVKLECYGTWRSGENRYLLGRITHHMASSNEETFRCFIYKQTKNGVQISQSADATCNAIETATEGPLTLTMVQEPDPVPQCNFPTWLTQAKEWHDMTSSTQFVFSSPEARALRQYSFNGTSAVRELTLNTTCLRQDNSTEGPADSFFRAVTFVVRGCGSGFTCLNWRRRSDQVVQLQQGRFSPYADQACSDGNFSNATEWITLVAHASREVPCPFPGHYLIPTAQPSRYASRCGEMTKVTIGCNRNTVVQFQTHSDTTDCPAAEPGEIIESTSMEFTCHGHWMDKKVGYFVASERRNLTKHCFIYQEDNGVLRLTSIPNRCPVSLNSGEQFNVTQFSECSRHHSAAPPRTALTWLTVLTALLALFVMSR